MELVLPVSDNESPDGSANPSVGVLLINLGTPDAPRFWPVRRYLAEFLSDPLVIDLPRLPWLLLLHGGILNIRPFRTAAAYRKIWHDDGSPLLVNTENIARGLETELSKRCGKPVLVETAMRYGNPSLAAAVAALHSRGADHIVLFPLYPQFSHTTTTTSFQVIDSLVANDDQITATQRVKDYHDHPGYIDALAASIRRYWETKDRGKHLVVSFHGLPQRYTDDGDPYRVQCEKTAALLAAALNLSDDDWTLCYQSQVGREEWLRPYAVDAIDALAKRNLGTCDIVCPGFPADCLETLEEIELGIAKRYSENGGGVLRYIPALNDDPQHIEMLCQLAMDNSRSWLSSSRY